MERIILKTIAMAAFCLAATAEKASADAAMKAIYLEKKFIPGSSDESNSEAALKLYRKMGYNTIFEFIAPPTTGWDKSDPNSWTIKTDPAAEMDRPWLVNYIREQKARVNALGMEYSPMYYSWGWGRGEVGISDRARAAVYRNVPVYGSYGTNVYPGLSKTVGGDGTVNWNGGTSAATLTTHTGAGKSTAATVVFWRGASSNTQVVTTHQPYRLKSTVTPSPAHPLKVGDRISVLLYQEFAVKPDPAVIPLGLHINSNPANKLLPLTKVEYLITKTYSGGGYDVYSETRKAAFPSTEGVICLNCTSFDAEIDIWVEDATTLGAGHAFSNLLMWETSITTGESRAVSSIATVSGFNVTRVNPTGRLAYPDWETNYVHLFPEDNNLNMRAVAKYERPFIAIPLEVEVLHFPNSPPPSPWIMTNIRGHFLPTSEGHGAPLIRLSIDPLSPAHDLIVKEMLKIIKEGLGGVEPKYYCLGGDEVFVYRRDNLSRLGAPNSIYSAVPDGEFYARIIERDLNRYKEIFTPHTTPAAKFLVWGDMFVPTGDGFGIYADSHSDRSALAYWQQKGLQNMIQPNVWIYDEMRVPGGTTLLLENASEVQKSLTPLIGREFRYSISYSTYGKLSDIQPWKPQVVTHEDHLQHEIAMAKNWFNIVHSSGNKEYFEGFLFTGWNPNVRLNGWNGLYPMAYFGGIAPSASDLPASWKARAPNLDINGQPVLNLLMRKAWPPVDAQPAIRSLLLE